MSPGFFTFAMTKSLREVLRRLKALVAAHVVRLAVVAVRRPAAVGVPMATDPDRQEGAVAGEQKELRRGMEVAMYKQKLRLSVNQRLPAKATLSNFVKNGNWKRQTWVNGSIGFGNASGILRSSNKRPTGCQIPISRPFKFQQLSQP